MDYRLFFKDSEDHIRDVIEMVCADDEMAIRKAESLSDGREMELWRLAVHLKTFPRSR